MEFGILFTSHPNHTVTTRRCAVCACSPSA